MEVNSHSPRTTEEGAAPIERRSILLRGYVETDPPPKSEGRRWTPPPSRFKLFFDTETTDEAAQRLRFGCYQLWEGDHRLERGIFYDPGNVKPSELAELRRVSGLRGHRLVTAANFVDRTFYPSAKAGALIVGFNLPFDISRLAIDHQSARAVRRKNGTVDRSMQGGFTFKLSSDPKNGNVRIKHLSRRAAFINSARPTAERGFFLDLRTLAAALTSQSHSLDSLARSLNTATAKAKFSDFGRDIDEEFISYAIDDVEVTRQCYERLIVEYDKHGFSEQTPPTRIYSEASLGKAYLEVMKIRPWRQVQRDFPNEILGAIMGSYFGGRSEVHRRREVVRTIYCDFTSMYPTVCTLQGLWEFVIGTGIDWQDATAETEAFLAGCDLAALRNPATWKLLRTLVRIRPDEDIFPVRACYGRDAIATIGLNYLSSNRGFWFTLADCVASKLLTGKAPKVEQAIRFSPRAVQRKLAPVVIAGNPEYRIVPNRDDFYRRLIDLRRMVQAKAKQAAGDEAERLHAEQLALKILANATSYGIFIEINVEDLDERAPRTVHGADGPFRSSSDKLEQSGKYFHPLLATLITGAARLMLAISERLALYHGLDWTFCDTDSMAFTLTPDVEDNETSGIVLQDEVGQICDWFESLNPYEVKGSILKLEDQNFLFNTTSNALETKALYCYAVSAKRYALFNKSPDNQPIIRKASAHGLGHLYPPYRDEDPDSPERESGVLLWQEELWRDIVSAALRGEPRPIPFASREQLNFPAASRYSATTPHILSWFRKFNEDRPYSEQIRPFNFLVWFHAKRPDEIFWQDGNEQSELWDRRAKSLKPVAPYDSDFSKAADKARDRETWEPVARAWLRTYAEALRQYAIHPETKFLGGSHTQSGPLCRRHVFATVPEYIGKEADRWEEDSHFGADEDSAISYGVDPADRTTMTETIARAIRVDKVGVKELAKRARLADRAVTRAVAGDPAISDDEIVRLFRAAEDLLAQKRTENEQIAAVLEWAKTQPRSRLAAKLGYDLSNLRKVMTGKIRPKSVLAKLSKLRDAHAY
jgi:hypothetical protein